VSEGIRQGRRRRDLFLCHSAADKANIVIPLSRELAASGVTFWLDEAEIKLGESITQKIGEGLCSARYVMAFISRSFLRRKWPQQELRAALALALSTVPTRVLPILVGVRAETFFRHYPLLSDVKCGSTKDGLHRLAEQLSHLLGGARVPRQRDAPVVEIDMLGLRKMCLLSPGRPPLWLRLRGGSQTVPVSSAAGFDQMRKLIESRGMTVHIDWDRGPSPEKRYAAAALLSIIAAYGAQRVEGFDGELRRKRGVFVHSFRRPAYSTKDPEALSVKAASGAILDDETIALLNVPAFFEAGWRDEVSIAPIVLGRRGVLREVLRKEELFAAKGDNPWVPHDIDPMLVVVPYSRLSFRRRRLLRRYKYAPAFARAAICPTKSTIGDARFLRNNGFTVVDRVNDATQLLSVCQGLVDACRHLPSATRPQWLRGGTSARRQPETT